MFIAYIFTYAYVNTCTRTLIYAYMQALIVGTYIQKICKKKYILPLDICMCTFIYAFDLNTHSLHVQTVRVQIKYIDKCTHAYV